MNGYFYPAKIVKYNAKDRTANVTIEGLTEGVDEGIVALLAYPIGDDDTDTERELLAGADVWVFFEKGDQHCPVVAFYRSHGEGKAVVDYRRIRQENIELLARRTLTLTAKELATIEAETIHLKATTLNIEANIEHKGNQKTSGLIEATKDVKGGGKSLIGHSHKVLSKDYGVTSPPN